MVTLPADNTTIADVLPSYYWPQNAIVIITACGHKHVRPKNVPCDVGASFFCPFCHDASDPPEKGAI